MSGPVETRRDRAIRRSIARTSLVPIRAGDTLAVLVTAVMMLQVIVDVTLRYTTGRGLDATVDFVANWWMPALTFAALGSVELTGRHIEARFLRDGLAGRSVRLAGQIATGLTILVAAVMGWAGTTSALAQMRRGEKALVGLAFPIWPARFLLPFGMLLLLLALLSKAMVRDDGQLRSEGPEGDD